MDVLWKEVGRARDIGGYRLGFWALVDIGNRFNRYDTVLKLEVKGEGQMTSTPQGFNFRTQLQWHRAIDDELHGHDRN